MGVEDGGVGGAVAQVLLDGAQIDAVFQQMSGVGMAQRMDGGPFPDPALEQGLAEDNLQAGSGKGAGGRRSVDAAAATGGKEPDGVAMSEPELPKQFQGALR